MASKSIQSFFPPLFTLSLALSIFGHHTLKFMFQVGFKSACQNRFAVGSLSTRRDTGELRVRVFIRIVYLRREFRARNSLRRFEQAGDGGQECFGEAPAELAQVLDGQQPPAISRLNKKNCRWQNSLSVHGAGARWPVQFMAERQKGIKGKWPQGLVSKGPQGIMEECVLFTRSQSPRATTSCLVPAGACPVATFRVMCEVRVA